MAKPYDLGIGLMGSTVLSHPPTSQRKHNLAAAFLAQNCALGLTYGSYGTLLHAIESQFGTTRAIASAGMSAMLLVLGLASPVIGKLLQRFSIRSTMVSGALICSLAYGVLAVAPTITVILAGYALAGAGICLLGIIAPTTLISRWYTVNRGKALGIVNLPLLMLLTPMAVAALLPGLGLRGVFSTIAVIYLGLIPLLLVIVDQPMAEPGAAHLTPAKLAAASLPLSPIFTTPSFWLLTIGIGILTGAGTSFVVHFVSIATSRGLTIGQAAGMLAGYGIVGIAGTLLFGWLADNVPPHIALLCNAIACACLWGVLLTVTGFGPMLIVVCLIGACTTALVALQGAAVGQLFGVDYVSSVMGVTYFFKLPFIFGSAPLVGYLFDRTGSYSAGISLHIAGFLVAAVAFAAIGITLRNKRSGPSWRKKEVHG